MKNKLKTKITIEIVTQEHFIEGNDKLLLLKTDNASIPLFYGDKDTDLVSLMDVIGGIKWRMSQLGLDIIVKERIEHDPNFETQAEADKYLQEM